MLDFTPLLFFFLGIFLHSVDRFNEEAENGVVPVGRSNTGPSLDEQRIDGIESV